MVTELMSQPDPRATLKCLVASFVRPFGKVNLGENGIIAEFATNEVHDLTFAQIDALRAEGHVLRAVAAVTEQDDEPHDHIVFRASEFAAGPKLVTDAPPAAATVATPATDDVDVVITHDAKDSSRLAIGSLALYRRRAGTVVQLLAPFAPDDSPASVGLDSDTVLAGDEYWAGSRFGASAEVLGATTKATHAAPVIAAHAHTEPAITGTAATGDEGATVTVYRAGSTLVGTAVIASGAWSLTVATTAGWSLTAVVGSGDTISPTSAPVVVS